MTIFSLNESLAARRVAPLAKPPSVSPTWPRSANSPVSHCCGVRIQAITSQPPPSVVISQYTWKGSAPPAPSGSMR